MQLNAATDLSVFKEDKKRLDEADSKVRESLIDQLETLNYSSRVVGNSGCVDIGKLLGAGGLNEYTGLPEYAIAPVGIKKIELNVSDDGVLRYEGYDKDRKSFEVKTLWKSTKINIFVTIRVVPACLCMLTMVALIVSLILGKVIPGPTFIVIFTVTCAIGVVSSVWGGGKQVYRVKGKRITLPRKINISNYVFDHLGLAPNKDYVVVFPFNIIQNGQPLIFEVISIGEEEFFIPIKPKVSTV